MLTIWRNYIGVLECSERRLADQRRQIKVNNWLSDLEIEELTRKIEHDGLKEYETDVTTENNRNNVDNHSSLPNLSLSNLLSLCEYLVKMMEWSLGHQMCGFSHETGEILK